MSIFKLLAAGGVTVLLCSGCLAAGGLTIHQKLEGSEVSVTLKSIGDASKINSKGTVVYGYLLIQSNEHLIRADLSCIRLQVNGVGSSKPYVDRVAHVLTEKFSADGDGKIRADLYWIFREMIPAQMKSGSLGLQMEKANSGQCVTAGRSQV